MTIQKLDIFRVRNIDHASLTPSPNLNFIYGANGSGKSSILEAIYILGRASSFRTRTIKHVINEQSTDLIVTGQILQANNFQTQLGLLLNAKESNIHINQKTNCKRSELAYSLPLQIIHPKSYLILDSVSALRREFIDWGVFNQHEEFLLLWRNYKKILHHRNILLKSKSVRQMSVWDSELVQFAQKIDLLRSTYLRDFESIFTAICANFLEYENLNFQYYSGWDSSIPFEQILKNNLEKDLKFGYTQHGPHRCDFNLYVNHKLAKYFLSRGHLKLLVLSLKLAQVQMMYLKSSKICTLLIDDLTSEIDSFNRSKLINYLSIHNCQVFITATEYMEFGILPQNITDYKLFHVEQGKIQSK